MDQFFAVQLRVLVASCIMHLLLYIQKTSHICIAFTVQITAINDGGTLHLHLPPRFCLGVPYIQVWFFFVTLLVMLGLRSSSHSSSSRNTHTLRSYTIPLNTQCNLLCVCNVFPSTSRDYCLCESLSLRCVYSRERDETHIGFDFLLSLRCCYTAIWNCNYCFCCLW